MSGKEAILDASVHYHGIGISRLQFVLSGGSYSKTVIGSPSGQFGAALAWDTTDVPNGTYQLQSLVTAQDGKSTYSPPITIKVDN